MEHPSKNDFFLLFKGIFRSDGQFEDYVLTKTSDNFQKVTNINLKKILGERISKIATEEDNSIHFREIQAHMIPNTKRKYEIYIDSLKKTYLINIFSDEKDYLIIYYNDISKYKEKIARISEKLNKTIGKILEFDKKRRDNYKDSLTGLYNREFFYEELKRLDTKRQLPLSIIMGDVNGLKLINDAFGHDMGDKVLERVGKVMKESFRKEDIIARVGGDEFMVLLPKTEKKTATEIINRLKGKYAKNPLGFIKINISFGVATKRSIEDNTEDIVKKAEDRMYFKKLKEGKAAKLDMINFLKKKLQEISFENKEHYERLKALSEEFANILDFTEVEKEKIKLLCEYHDIGKIGIPKKILQKKSKLTQEEWKNMKKHSEIGYNIIKETREVISIDELILYHHERWDGKGYPGIFKGEEIPKVVRLFSILDAYDSMVNERPYKERKTPEEALKEIKNNAGSQFDPYIAEIFIERMRKREKQIG